MAHLAHSIHFLIQLVILVVGRSCYRENPHPELSRYKDVDRKHKNTTYDQAFEGCVAMFPGSYVPPHLCSPGPMFPHPMFPSTYVPRHLWTLVLYSPVPMFPSTYIPRYLCSPVLSSPVPMFPGTYVPRYLCSPVPMFPCKSMFPLPMFSCTYAPTFHQYLCCPVHMVPMS